MSKAVPSICQASRDTLSALATSSAIGVAPSAFNADKPGSPRAVAVTVSPAARYCRANSSPIPREAPTISTFTRTQPL